jgi:small subunit ribosomal protein S1
MKNEFLPEGEYIKVFERGRDAGSDTVMCGRALMCDRRMNLYVDMGSGRGIIPQREIAYCEDGVTPKDIAVITRVGKPVSYVVIGEENGYPLLSRREAQKRCWEERLSQLIPGDIIPAEVTHLEPFGAFLDIGCGYPALMSVDAISVSRISHPRDRLSVGDRIMCVVRSIDRVNRRIFVSQRELYGTWEENAEMFSAGQTVRGIVRSVESYGVFVELMPNLAGLCEVRPELLAGIEPEGRFASVYIKSIIPGRMKVKLVLIELLDKCTSPVVAPYFIDCEETGHMDAWRYSPAGAPKLIMTDFTL